MRVNYIKKEVHLLKIFNMKKIIILLLISVVFSCKSDPVLFELTTSVNPLGSGTVSPDKGTVWLGDQIEFSAEANTGYSFVKWSGDLNDSLSKISLIIDSDKSIIAEFTEMTKIPDNIFEKYLIEIGVDDNIDGFVNTSKIKKITSLNLSEKGVNDLTGIEDFLSLKVLIANDNLISKIDLSLNTELEILYLDNNSIKNLDLSTNTKLQKISLNDNLISGIDLSLNTELEILYLNNNSIKDLDLSTNTKLQKIELNNNSIQNLDLSLITNLVDFSSINNEMLCIKISTSQIISSKNWFTDAAVIFDTIC